MNLRFLLPAIAFASISIGSLLPSARATSNYTYQPEEYVVIVDGRSPDDRYAIAAHGDGELGYDNFHLYLMDAQTNKKIGPLEEVNETLDTGADAFYAHWSADSRQVSITYRADRHVAVMIRYRIANRRAYCLNGPTRVTGLPGR
jgi:hypothetical protein